MSNADANRGTKNKQKIQERAEKFFAKWKQGSADDWAGKLAYWLGISPRTAMENYIEPSICVGVLEPFGNGNLRYVGPAVVDEEVVEILKDPPKMEDTRGSKK